MKNQQETCTDENMWQLFRERRFDELYPCLWEKCCPKVSQFVLNNGGSEQDAEDVFIEACFEVFRKMLDPAFKWEGSLCKLIFVIAQRKWFAIFNARTKEKKKLEEKFYLQGKDDETVLMGLFPSKIAAIQACLKRIAEKCTLKKPEFCQSPVFNAEYLQEKVNQPTCFILHSLYFEKMTEEAIGLLIGMTKQGVNNRRHRTCEPALKECLMMYYPDALDFQN